MNFYKLLAIVLFIGTISCYDFDKLVINDQNSKDDTKLKDDHANILITSFVNAQIFNVQRNGSSAKITFTSDPTGEHKSSLVAQVENDQNITHNSMVWLNPSPNEEYCFNISGDQHWYTTYEELVQKWPIDKTINFSTPQAFVTNDQYFNPIGSIVENLFLGSDGVGIYVKRGAPLFFRRVWKTNGNSFLCFSGDYNKRPYNHSINKKDIKIVFHMFSGTDIMHVYRYAANRWIRKPEGMPNPLLFQYPIWSTWVRYHKQINQNKVLAFANQITSYGFPNSLLEIDDKWEVSYGDFSFDPKKFPNPKQMVSTLRNKGYLTSLWVYPFVNTNSKVFVNESQYFIKAQNGSVLLQKWWDGVGAYVDFTSELAQNWFVSRLESIKNATGIVTFKFDAGELGWISPQFLFSNQSFLSRPSAITRLYAETASRLGNLIEVRVGYGSQRLPIFVRMLDRNSIWSYLGGLRTMIPTALMMSIAGYPFVLPDMIGGNGYGNIFPSKELFIRWLQINTFMPSMQFSITPWDYGVSSKEVINISKSMLRLRELYLPLILSLAENAVKTGEPIMRPLWWVAPTDSNTFTIEDQFLVGNDLMVAPVIRDKTRKRNIYLPSGQWKDGKGVIRTGPKTLIDYGVALSELPYFTRV